MGLMKQGKSDKKEENDPSKLQFQFSCCPTQGGIAGEEEALTCSQKN